MISRFASTLPATFAAAAATSGRSPQPLPMLVSQLGLQTRVSMEGDVVFNEPLVQQIVSHREMALPHLEAFFNGVFSIPGFLEGLHAVGRLADARVPGVQNLYPALRRWNSHPDPLVQIHLARLYAKINPPQSFGPTLSTLMYHAVNQYPMQASPTYNVTEAVGETVLKQIAERSADATVQRLLPYLQPLYRQ